MSCRDQNKVFQTDLFVIKKVKNTVRWMYVIEEIVEKIVGTF